MPSRAVDQQVGEPRRQDRRLLRTAVVVRPEVDGVLVDVAQHLHRQRRQPRLGVSHGGGRVVAGRAEVAVAVDQRVAQRPRLRHPHQGVVDRRVTVRVVVTHDVADDAGALDVAAVRPEAAVEHGVEDLAVHRLEAVPHVGQRPADDDAHRVVEVRALHLDLEPDRLDAAARRRSLPRRRRRRHPARCLRPRTARCPPARRARSQFNLVVLRGAGRGSALGFWTGPPRESRGARAVDKGCGQCG